MSRFGSSTDFVVRYALEKWGLIPDRDVAILQIGSQPARFTALKSGTVRRNHRRTARRYHRAQGGLQRARHARATEPCLPEYLHRDDRLQCVKNEDLTRRVMKAVVEGIHFFKTQKEASSKSLDAFVRLEDADLIEETYRHYKEIFPTIPYPDVKGIQNVLNEIAKKDPKAKGLKPETFTDIRFLKELEASGLDQQLYQNR